MVNERGDRHDPSGEGGYLSVQHMERYQFALERVRPNQKVLDIACGTGYGTIMFKEHGCEVTGGDIDAGQLEQNRLKWNYEEFVVADVLDLPFDDESFDVVVSFETIEHVLDGEKFLLEMFRVIRPGGVFICSTPNIRYSIHPSFHLKEYRPEEFYKLIGNYFSDVELLAQYIKPIDRFKDLCRHHLLGNLRMLLGWLGIKIIIKRMLKSGDSQPMMTIEVTECHLSDTPPKKHSVDYSVRHYDGNELLRIMVVVARKQ